MKILIHDGEQWLDVEKIESVEDVPPDGTRRPATKRRAVTMHSGRMHYSAGTADDLVHSLIEVAQRADAEQFLRAISLHDGSTQKMSGHGDL